MTWSSRPLVLLAEDDPDVRALVGTLLERWGYQVAATGSGHAALELAAEQTPRLAIFDVELEVPDGIQLTRAFRADDELRDVPIILLTVHADDERAREGKAAGASGHVVKPFRAQALRKAIWSIVPTAPEHAA